MHVESQSLERNRGLQKEILEAEEELYMEMKSGVVYSRPRLAEESVPDSRGHMQQVISDPIKCPIVFLLYVLDKRS
jgi:hypothetical protein